VGKKSLDEFAGIISVKTIFPLNLTNDNFSIKDHLKQPIIVHENTPAYKVLEKFKEEKFHYAIVVDEYGSIQGLVAMDDVVDALLGDTTEFDQDEYSITERDNKTWLADAQLPYYVFSEYFDLPEKEADFNTLGGLVLHQLNHIPVTGEKVKWNDFEFEVVDMDNMRIDKLIITREIG
jgi:putative hemolysin